MWRSILLVSASLCALAGCGEVERPSERQTGFQELLDQGDARACAHPDVARTIRTLADKEAGADYIDHGIGDSLENVTIAGFDDQTKKMACRARWVLGAEGREVGAVAIDYTVQPVVTGDDAVVSVSNFAAVLYALRVAALDRKREASPASSEPAETRATYEEEPTPSSIYANEDSWEADLAALVAEGRRLCEKAAQSPLTGDDILRARGTAKEIGQPQSKEEHEVVECLLAASQAGN